MTNDDRKTFPRLAAWIQSELPGRFTGAVRSAFITASELTVEDALKAVTRLDTFPWLRFDFLGSGARGVHANGAFRNEQPNWIFVDIGLARRFEQDFGDLRAQKLAEATILHELVHWGWFKVNAMNNEPQEQGLAFEDSAYGHSIERYWSDAPETPLFVFPVTGRIGGGTSHWGEGLREAGAKSHSGIDVFNSIGTTVHAAADGVVVSGDRYRRGTEHLVGSTPYGQMIDIDHGNGLVTRYAHLDSVEVDPGPVRQGARIGTLGASGTEYGEWYYGGRQSPAPPTTAVRPHLHFEVRSSDAPMFGDFKATQDPATYFGFLGHGAAALNSPVTALAAGSKPAPGVSLASVSEIALPVTSRGIDPIVAPNLSPNAPRGLRNRNPGNIRLGERWLGLVPDSQQTDAEFCQFQTFVFGIRAIARILRSYSKRDIRTLRVFAQTWAPGADRNNPLEYARTVLRSCGARVESIDQAVDLTDAQVRFGVIRGICVAENGATWARVIGDDVVVEGIKLEVTS